MRGHHCTLSSYPASAMRTVYLHIAYPPLLMHCTAMHAGGMANVKISPLSYQADPDLKLPTGTSSSPVTDAAPPVPGKRAKAARTCHCWLEVEFKTAKWLYFVGFVLQCIVSWVFR
jgi:hypothetical protein